MRDDKSRGEARAIIHDAYQSFYPLSRTCSMQYGKRTKEDGHCEPVPGVGRVFQDSVERGMETCPEHHFVVFIVPFRFHPMKVDCYMLVVWRL
jgi:hypothetical protein